MIGPVREREHFVDKLALSRSIRRRIWATRASPRSAQPQRHEDPWAGNTSPRASASPCGYEKGNLRRHSPRRRPRRIMKRRAMSSQAEPNYISKARSWTWNRATLGSCRKALATATRSGSVHCAGGHHPARGSARPGQKRASRLNHAIPSRDCDSPFRLAPWSSQKSTATRHFLIFSQVLIRRREENTRYNCMPKWTPRMFRKAGKVRCR